MNKRPGWIAGAGLVVWVAAAIAALGYVTRYNSIPGVAANAPAEWPAASKLHPRPGEYTVVAIFHPHCPCSRASMGELASVMSTRAKVHGYAIFVTPPGMSEQWSKTDLWASAGRIPGIRTVIDDGTEARIFGAATSGQTFVYDPHGRLVFSGGITVARGHYGDNAGLTEVREIIDDGKTGGRADYPVYGCPLFSKDKGGKVRCVR